MSDKEWLRSPLTIELNHAEALLTVHLLKLAASHPKIDKTYKEWALAIGRAVYEILIENGLQLSKEELSAYKKSFYPGCPTSLS